MSLEKAERYLEHKGMLDRVIRLKESTATVAEAAEALGVEAGDDSEDHVISAGWTGGTDSDRRNSEDR